jgi:hypothetical protein
MLNRIICTFKVDLNHLRYIRLYKHRNYHLILILILRIFNFFFFSNFILDLNSLLLDALQSRQAFGPDAEQV